MGTKEIELHIIHGTRVEPLAILACHIPTRDWSEVTRLAQKRDQLYSITRPLLDQVEWLTIRTLKSKKAKIENVPYRFGSLVYSLLDSISRPFSSTYQVKSRENGRSSECES